MKKRFCSMALGAVLLATNVTADSSASTKDGIEHRADALYEFVLRNGCRIEAEDVDNKLPAAGFVEAEIPDLIEQLITDERVRQSDRYLMVIHLC
ncbi:hypothetical protein [Ruegeria meonggei]|uniref:hypothetical protein n=1 Tax=Ruegeria meonggei TaxID=1446476 RepID=UPI00366FEC12